MPLYEFKCIKCQQFIELLIMKKDEEVEIKCPECGCQDLERVLSTTNYSMGNGAGTSKGVKTQSRTCGSGTCTTYEIPGHTR